MRKKTIFMFSGQGSQYFQMGRELYDQGGTFARLMRDMDVIVRDTGGRSVLSALYGGQPRSAPFDDIRLTHPAIFMVEYALARCLMEAGIEPDLTLGVSLGSVAASVVSGCMGHEDALQWVVRHADWISENCQAGGMIGVLGPQALHETSELRSVSVVAAENGPSHWVLSAQAADLSGIEHFLSSRQVPHAGLPVKYPFHSPWMVGSSAHAEPHVPMPETRAARVPLMCCAQNQLLTRLPEDHFWRVAIAPILFEQSIRRLEASESPEGALRYIDLGPSPTLATLLKYLLGKNDMARVHSVLSPYGRNASILASVTAHLLQEAL